MSRSDLRPFLPEELGAAARRAGQPTSACPYARGLRVRLDWMAGWVRESRRHSDPSAPNTHRSELEDLARVLGEALRSSGSLNVGEITKLTVHVDGYVDLAAVAEDILREGFTRS